MIKSLSVDLILTNLGTQMRAAVDDDVVEHYAALWKQDHAFPPLDVFDDGDRIILADGFHRLYGAKAAKKSSIKCDVHPGSLRDAILFACGANSDHGMHRTRKDKRLAVETLLGDAEWGKRSARWIAEQCKVSDPFVLTIKAERKPPQPTQPATAKVAAQDGKQYPATNPKTSQVSQPAAAGANVSTSKSESQAEVKSDKGLEFDTAKMDADKAALAVDDTKPLAERIEQQNKIIESFARKVMAAFTEDHPDDPWLDESRLNIAKDQIKSACATIRLAKACDKPCPKCGGKGCKTCRQCGYLPKSSYEAAGGK